VVDSDGMTHDERTREHASTTIDQDGHGLVWYLVYWRHFNVCVDEYDSPEAAVAAAENDSVEGFFSPVAIFSPDGERTSLWDASFYTAGEMDQAIARALAKLDDDEPLVRLQRDI
jgi:hypothetical protein